MGSGSSKKAKSDSKDPQPAQRTSGESSNVASTSNNSQTSDKNTVGARSSESTGKENVLQVF